jgi:hypothetical protein
MKRDREKEIRRMDAKSRKNPRAMMPPAAEAHPPAAASAAAATPPESAAAPLNEAIAAPAARLRETPGSAGEAGAFAGLAALAGRPSSALARSQAAFVQGLEELSVEMAGIARSGLESAARGATEMLAVKTLTDAVDLHLSLAQKSFEAFVGGSLRMAELGIETARKAAEPFFAELFASPL